MRHTISVTFENNFNALSRITGLFSGRGYRIDSISFGPAEEEGLARMTLTTEGDEHIIEQITKHLHRLVDVIKVTDLTYLSFVERELALIKISAPPSRRSEIMQITQIFRANIVDISPKTLTIEATGKEDKVNAMLDLLRPFGILEVARTGCIALQREYQSKHQHAEAAASH
ncbi:MAG TPA: acetolactate synthase small subunit [Bacteroidetes bacterium]|nr:acetolactate synthase small subunit [Bacteroidota bacterium]